MDIEQQALCICRTRPSVIQVQSRPPTGDLTFGLRNLRFTVPSAALGDIVQTLGQKPGAEEWFAAVLPRSRDFTSYDPYCDGDTVPPPNVELGGGTVHLQPESGDVLSPASNTEN